MTALAAERNGSPKDNIFKQNAVFSFFIKYFPAGSARKNSSKRANEPKKNEYPKQAFAGVVYKDFEGIPSPIPSGYDTYLKMAFGDYMMLPPKEKQKPHHDTVFSDIDAPCDTYRGIHFLTENKEGNPK